MVQLRSSQAVLRPEIQENRPPVWLAGVVLLCFLTSGATSLVLEGTLTRLLRFVLGNTSLAVTTVLCAFMGGLALGSYVAGRLCHRTNRLLRLYGLLEGAAGVSCLLLPVVIQAFQPVYRSMYLHLQDSPVILSLARFLLCSVLLVIPSTFMGATLPVLSRWYALRFGKIGRSIAGLYAINSAGAGIGALVCGFVLLPDLGVTWTLRLACGIAVAICAAMLLLDRGSQAVAEPEPTVEGEARSKAREKDTNAEVLPSGWRTGLLAAYGLSGAAALVYEVGWTRALALVVGSTTYAFSLMLAAFILGLALGSALMVRLIDRMRNRLQWFGIVELGIGLSAVAALPVFGQMPVWIVSLLREHHKSFAMMQVTEFGLMLLVMMVPTTLMGAAFPLVSRACAAGAGQVGRSVGGVYAANTVGAIAGTFLASFVLIPQLGTQNAILVAAASNVLIATVVLWLLPSIRWGWRAGGVLGLAVFGGLVLLALPPWDPAVMTSGAYLYASNLSQNGPEAASIRQRMHVSKVIFHDEDMCTSVTVRDHLNGVRSLSVGGKVDASTGEDVATQILIAHAPLLLHPDPRHACVIGLASGMTLAAAACHDLESIDCVEISPAVVAASYFFEEYNGSVLADPRVQLIIGDGRNHLVLTPRQYDVIISEPSNPWIAGVADLFTEEYFRICRQRLAPHGLACTWLQAYQFDEPLFRSVVRTFHDVFPHMIILEAKPLADYVLIGSVEPIRVPAGTLTQRFASSKAAADLKEAGIDGLVKFLRCIVTSTAAGEYARGGMLHTDDNALLEFAAPRELYHDNAALGVAAALNRYRKVDLSFLHEGPGEQAAVSSLRQALDPLVEAQRTAMDALVRLQRGDLKEAYALAAQAAKIDPEGPELLNSVAVSLLGKAAVQQQKGNLAEALAYCEQAASIAPAFFDAQDKFGELLLLASQWPEAMQAFEQAIAIRPDELTALNNGAWLLAACPDGRVRNGARAVEWAERTCRLSEYKVPASLGSLAAAYAETGRFEEAVRTAQKALELAGQGEQTSLVGSLERQIALYRQGQPYRLGQE